MGWRPRTRCSRGARFVIDGEPEIMRALDTLLRDFVAQNRMKMSGDYKPCYKLVA